MIKFVLPFFLLCYSALIAYPHFEENPYLDETKRLIMERYLLPLDHPLKSQLDAIFSQFRVLESKHTLQAAGFEIIAAMPGSFVIVAKHPAMPGYVFKMYLDSEERCKDGVPNCLWLARRCAGAQKIRKVISAKKIRHFVVPDKWLYVLPLFPVATGPYPQPVILIATDMKLASERLTTRAWKTFVRKKHLDELYAIIRHGYGSVALVRNIPYTLDGKFAFTDTEYPIRKFKFERVKQSLSEDMQRYWDQLID